MYKKLILSIIITFGLSLTIPNKVHSFVLDDLNKQERIINGKPQIITPLQESIERGRTEGFAQYTGQIIYTLTQNETENQGLFTGIGTLIGPNTVLTAAHVVQKYLENPSDGYFLLKNNNDSFKRKIKKVILPDEYPTSKTLLSLENEEYKLNSEKIEKLLEYENFIIESGLTEETRQKLCDPAETKKLLFNPDLSNDERNKLLKFTKKTPYFGSEMYLIDQKIDIFKKQNKKKFINKLKYDIAIIQLENEIPNINNFPTLDDGEMTEGSAYGVSINNVTRNSNGKMISQGCADMERHISKFSITNEDSLLKCKLNLPDDYKYTTLGNEGPKQFKYNNCNPTPPRRRDPFLKGSTQNGDSGCPLLIQHENAPPKILGVLSTTRSHSTSIDPYPAGGEYVHIWTPVSIHKNWIEKTMQSLES